MDVGTRGEQDYLAQSPATHHRHNHHRHHHPDDGPDGPISPRHLMSLHDHHDLQQLHPHPHPPHPPPLQQPPLPPQPQPQHSYPDDGSFLPSATQLDFRPYAATDLQALASSDAVSAVDHPFAYHAAIPTTATPAAVNPDDFYRNYRGVQTANANVVSLSSPTQDAMASPALPPNRQTPTAAVRNGTGTRPGVRSASSTLDDRLGGATDAPRQRQVPAHGFDSRGNALSVKNLKKKFDQSSPQAADASMNKGKAASSRLPTREALSSPSNGRSPAPNGAGAASSYPALRTGTTRDGRSDSGASSSRSTTQRPRFLPEDELSSNAQSFASRVSRPRTATAPTARPSKSMTHLSPNASPRPPTSPPPPSRGALLFGEILPQDHDAITAGYGIENSRLRPTSESSSQNPARKHLRSHSDPDVEPPSPTDWYRNAGPVENPPHPSVGPRAHKGHSRAHSDAAAAKPINHSNGAPAAQAREVPPAVGPSSPTSRLPISTRKLNSPAPSSGGSSRSNSPALLKQSVGSRMARQQGTPTTRAKTPTSRSNTPTVRAKTPTPGHNASSRKAPPSQIGTPSNGRLNAYVNIAPPKLSPTLRSSRPRQSVATATTTASRMKSSDKTQPPQKSTQRGAPRPDEATVRRRKISVGPIDFAQRRETIKLAYSKSIKETQAKEASRAAAEKRRRDLELVAKAKVEAEAVHAAKALQKLQATEALQAVRPPPAPTVAATAEAASHARQEAASAQGSLEPPRNETPKLQEPLRIATTDLSTAPTIRPVDSPTLGIPGSFPAVGSPSVAEEEMYIPQSAISATSVATEFDIEPQTEPPTQESNTTVEEEAYIHVHAQGVAQRDVLGAAVLPDVPRLPPALHKRASYKYPFEDDSTSIHVTSPGVPRDQSAHSSPHLTPTRSEFDLEPQTDPPIPGSFQDEYEPQPFSYPSESYETTITILGPETDFRPSLDEQTRDADLITQPVDTDTILVGMVARRDVPSEPPSSHVDAFRESPRNHPMHSMQSLEDFYVGPRMRDNIAVLRDSTFTSSDQDGSYETVPSSAEFQKTPETAHSLSVPPLPASNRLSQHSAWTDFSFGSSDERDDRGRSSVSNTPDLSRQQSRSARSARPISGYSSQDAGYEELSTSQPISPLDDNDTSSVPPLPMLDEAVLARHRLPELEVGSGFTVSLPQEAAGAAHDVAARPPSPQPSELLEPLPDFPDHEPPPPPVSEYDLDDSSYAADTRPNSYYRQDDESEEPVPSLSTPHSGFEMTPEVAESQRALPDTKNRHSEVRGPVDAERKRLKQRQLVIRELIDTEAIFIRDLSVVEEIYKGTAEACPKLDAKTIKLVFRNTDEIIAFHAAFLAQLKDGVSSVYTPKGRKSPVPGGDSSSKDSDSVSMASNISPARSELDDEKDRQTSLGPLFIKNIEKLKEVHETYLRSSEQSTKRLLQIQEDPTVNVWLSECNEVARDLTSAWNLDSLLIKPMQRITKYPDIISHLLKHTLDDHPDREPLMAARTIVVNTIDEINKTKKNFELVGQIVGRKRKESEVRAGFARAFGKRVDKIQASTNRPSEDDEYAKLHEKFGDDYLRLQVVLRDVEFYTRTVSNYVHEFLQYLSSIELVMRLQPSKYHAHLEAKWVQFNVSMRDIEKIALDKHVSDVRKHVIEPFEQVIRCYGNPSLAMKKRAKRRLDYEKFAQLKANGKKIDKQLAEQVEQYEALNDALKKELPKLSALTASIGNICLGKFVSIQANWFAIWQEKVRAPLQENGRVPELSEIVSTFQRDFKDMEEEVMSIGILNPSFKGRTSQSTTDDAASVMSRSRSRPGEVPTPRNRGLSVNSDTYPTISSSEFAKRHSGHFAASPTALPSPNHYYRDYYSGISAHSRKNSGSPITAEPATSAARPAMPPVRPSTGRSVESPGVPRQSTDSAIQMNGASRRDSNSTYNSGYPNPEPRRLSGLFHSALPLPDEAEESQRSSRASSRDRGGNSGYNIMWLAASLFEFNIETTKHEAGYPYLTYQAGEIFDVIAEKGELWLAKNQDDPREQVGWIWSKHFAKLADS